MADRAVSYGLLISTLNYWHPDCYYRFVHFYFYREDSSLLLIARTLLAICSVPFRMFVIRTLSFGPYCSQQTSAPLQLLVGAGTVLSCEMADQVLKSVLGSRDLLSAQSRAASDAVRNALLQECVHTRVSEAAVPVRSSSGHCTHHRMLVMGTPVLGIRQRWRPLATLRLHLRWV